MGHIELMAGDSHSPKGYGHFGISIELKTGVSLSPKSIGDRELDSPETELGQGRKQPRD